MNIKNLKLAYVDDIAEQRQQIKQELQRISNATIVAEAEHGRDLIMQLFRLKKRNKLPDLILMDLQMPRCDGLTSTIVIKWFFPAIKIVGLSVHTQAPVIKQMVVEGADGFLSKFIVQRTSMVYPGYADDTALETAINKIFSYDKYIDPLLDNVNNLTYEGISCIENIRNNYSNIKPIEVGYILLNAAGFSRKEIANMLNTNEPNLKIILHKFIKSYGIENHEDLNRFAVMNGIVKYVELLQKTNIKSGLN